MRRKQGGEEMRREGETRRGGNEERGNEERGGNEERRKRGMLHLRQIEQWEYSCFL